METIRDLLNAPVDMDEYGDPASSSGTEAENPSNADTDDQPTQEQEQQGGEVQPQEEEQAEAQQAEPAPVKPGKRVQTPEENARFAEMRRQRQLQERVEQELKKRPEYQIAQMLSEVYGMPVEQLQQKLQEAILERKAKEQGIPVEVMKQIEAERKARMELEQRVLKSEFENWYNQKKAEAAQLKEQYKFLTDDDVNEAINYMLNDLKTVNMPLAQAVFALHGQKILAELQKSVKQEVLAEISGRKPGPLPNQGSGKPQPAATLTEEERYFARKLGMTDEEYIKWRDMEQE